MEYTILPVIRTKRLSEAFFELVLKKKREICYGPGDCIYIKKSTSDGTSKYRPYFIASGTQEPWLRVIIRANYRTMDLQALKAGDKVRVKPKLFSVFPSLASADRPVFICASVGISPFLSYISTSPSAKLDMYIIGDVPNMEWVKNYKQAIICASAGELEGKFKAQSRPVHYICAPKIQAQAIKNLLKRSGIKEDKINYIDFK